MDEQAQGEFVPALAIGGEERFAHQAAESLAQGVIPTLDVASLACAFTGAALRAPQEQLNQERAQAERFDGLIFVLGHLDEAAE